MKHIGIAAVSAEGAALTYTYICAQSEKHFGRLTHPEISIHGFSLSEYIDFGENKLEKWENLLVDSIEKLKSIGAEIVICPSNTPHEVYQQVSQRISIPWLNIAEAVASTALDKQLSKILLLGNEFIFASSVYPDAFSGTGVELVIPDADEQAFIHNTIISELVTGRVEIESRNRMNSLLNKYQAKGIEAVILGSTELPLIIDSSNTPLLVVLDSTKILGDAAIEAAKR